MIEFNPDRLIVARQRRSITAKALAEATGISAVHISRIEKGKAENLEESTVNSLAKALKFPVDFFYRDKPRVPLKEEVSFRSLSKMSAKERNAATAASAFAFEINDWVSERFSLPKVDLPDLSDQTSPAIAASLLRDFWGLGEMPLGNIIKLLESKGIRVFSLSENTRNVDAYSCWEDHVPYIFLNTYKTAERSRFDALHELGHLVMHSNGVPQGRQAENEANEFASYFLVPQADLIGTIQKVTSLNQLIKAKKRWGVSTAALAYRLHKVGFISDWQYKTFCIDLRKLYGQTEPEGLEREKSVLWDKVFKALWTNGQPRSCISKALSLPEHEIDTLLFGLIGGEVVSGKGKPKLSLA
ncbi:ImmA/IrrE family metallo-endopeptidase [Neptunomonas concharum]|uniref:ImmA/IrrE family metallo-endopeptidase n=2 Tax=Neptunomonas concharum TaxID=1031538 RepID=A0A5P1RFC2_9GAMM|nr:ImmA/IrrE family metallo-endopeptidase [Neptunomonas concharum]